MSAAEMREAAALAAHDALFSLCFEKHGGDLSGVTCADVSNVATSAIRALPLPDEEGMVERVSDAICRAAGGDPDGCEAHFHRKCEDCRMRARAAIRAINGGKT